MIGDAGKLRNKNVCVRSEEGIIWMAPKYTIVDEIMDNLFLFLKKEKELYPSVKSSIFYYELEFIYPFLDGNG